jgi:aminodeoxyfutalosine deaminase
MNTFHAAWVCPIERPPISNGIVEVAAGRIVGIHDPGSRLPAPGSRDLGRVALLPGLVNAHTHLELSWLRGRVPPAARFTDWVTALLAERRPDQAMTPDQMAPIHDAIRELRATGTVAVGDVSNSLAAVAPMRQAGLDGLVFHELLGFRERDGALVEATREQRTRAAAAGARVSLAPHAPYSTSVELCKAIREAVSASALPIMSIHLGESPEEVELLERGSGPWRRMLERMGAWRHDWEVPGCGPVEFLERHGVLDRRTLVVHGVQFDDQALERIRQIGATLVTCPRSNRWVGVGDPPVSRFYNAGVAVAVGTDSLASVDDLNLFAELHALRRLAPSVPARRLLESATRVGARALGLDHERGTLTPGKRAELVAVALPDGVADVEEYLVSGIAPSQIQPVNL